MTYSPRCGHLRTHGLEGWVSLAKMEDCVKGNFCFFTILSLAHQLRLCGGLQDYEIAKSATTSIRPTKIAMEQLKGKLLRDFIGGVRISQYPTQIATKRR